LIILPLSDVWSVTFFLPKDSRIYVARQTQEIYLDRNNNNIFLHILGQKFKVKPVFNNLSAANTFKHILGLSLTGGTEIYYGEDIIITAKILLLRRRYYSSENAEESIDI